jgi:tetratricopeptide (TPR) repeat protein
MTSNLSQKSGVDKFTAQIMYNMGLAYFKGFHLSGEYAEECFRRCVMNDPKHPYAYKNLAFVKNLSAKYDQTIQVCSMAKEYLPTTHDTHAQWSFALMKRFRFVEAIRKVRKGTQVNPQNVDNWIVWGHLLRQPSTSKLHSARQKIETALTLDPTNEVALYEKKVIDRII